jgi:general secretion pathway protein D
MVYSSYSLFKRINQLLKTLDVPQAQVVIEATVAEVTLNDVLSRGVEAYLSSNNILNATTPSRSGLPSGPSELLSAGSTKEGGVIGGRFGIAGASVDVIMKALQTVTTVKVVSSPYLTVRDGKTARLVIGDQIPFLRSTSTVNGNGNGTVVEEVETRDTGVVLEVTPRIRPDNSTILTISQSVSNVKGEQTGSEVNPTISTRSVNSEVIAKSGSTILLAGLIKDSVKRTTTGVPVLQELAIVGDFFKQSSDEGRREELIVMITPRVIRNSAQIENITRELRGLLHIR